MSFRSSKLPPDAELPKLIRDRIPHILSEGKGIESQITVAKNDSEYLEYLLKKLVEESIELQQHTDNENLIEELADIQELISAVMNLMNISDDELKKVRKIKNEKNGSFKKRLILNKIILRP